MRRSRACALIMWLVASVARGGLVLDISPVASTFLASEAALTGFTAYQLDISTDDGALISAVDVSLVGPFHQRYSSDVGSEPTPSGVPSDGRGDSHLPSGVGALIASGPSENNGLCYSPMPCSSIFDYGIGTYLCGAWEVPASGQTDTASVAYLVVPDGKEHFVRGIVEFTTPTGTYRVHVALVPEPGAWISPRRDWRRWRAADGN
ncbi:MAG: hypothetical protein KDA44_09470 [Planctomycetales bacterium]|nr:hypothetical protein [Planctomycetales bacterium]